MLERRSAPRTHYIHKISYTTQERLVGAFVLFALIILVWLLFSSGKASSLFEDYLTVYAVSDTPIAINKDIDVTVSGITVGTVTDVEITDTNKSIITMDIYKEYQNLLHTDSTATAFMVDLAILGSSVIELSTGSNKNPVIKDNDTIQIVEVVNLKNLINNFTPTIKSIQTSVTKLSEILENIDAEKVGSTFDNLNAITTQIGSGEGTAGRLIFDNKTDENIRKTIENLQVATDQIKQILIVLNEEVENVPGLLQDIEPLLEEADKTIRATQKIWPLSSAVEKDDKGDVLTSPEPDDE